MSLQLLDLKSSDDRRLDGIAQVCHHLHPHNLSSDHRQCNGDANGYDHLIRALGENFRGPRLCSWLLSPPRLFEMPLSQKPWHFTFRGKPNRMPDRMPNRSTAKLLMKHTYFASWLTGSRLCVEHNLRWWRHCTRECSFFVILFHTINDTLPLPQPQLEGLKDMDKDRLMNTLWSFCVASILVGRYNW